ncbi:hypothetical protein EDD17DRAFT_1752711 [Pisolithus thermaeus]|nr:hypothetical protein EV401DRAFT_2066446 [Pisolithus croceorrhizus]KAI6166549.1 hypothetical protein EDD17DRAFT_1752711 [Pisolithus thermaeus]
MNDLPSTPLHDPSYLLSAIETIKNSLEDCSSVSSHDLLDAYNTLSRRLKSESQALQESTASFPAFECIASNRDHLFKAFRRDTGFAHIDPFSTDKPICRAPKDLLLPSIRSAEMGSIQIQRARDLSCLCNYALSTLAVVFKFVSLSSLFTIANLTELFGDVLSIVLAKDLPVFNSPKTVSLSLWILRSQCLPWATIRPHEIGLVTALQCSLNGPKTSSHTVLDGLKAVAHMLDHHAKDFFKSASQLLPVVLEHLLSESADCRFHASGVLCSFAAPLVRGFDAIPKRDRQAVSTCIFGFLQKQAALSDAPETLIGAIQAAFDAGSQMCPGDGPVWMLTVMASLIITCGPLIFSDAHTLDFVLSATANALTHDTAVVRGLHPLVWRCLIWVYARMLSEPEGINLDWESLAFRALKQELWGRTGIALTGILLHARGAGVSTAPVREDWRVRQAFTVIRGMVQSKSTRAKKEGIALLRTITSPTTSLTGICLFRLFDDMPPMVLFDGTIVNAPCDLLPDILRKISQFTVDRVCPLTKGEIAFYYETVFDGWCGCMPRPPTEHLDVVLVDVWRSLLVLLAQHHTIVQQAFEYAAKSLVKCLLPPCDPLKRGLWSVADQKNCLNAVECLWNAMKDATSTQNLLEAAQSILFAISKYEFNISNSETQRMWSVICADLMVVASPSFLGGMAGLTESQMKVKTQRQLWGIIATSLVNCASGVRWASIVDFLSVPASIWVLSEWELGVWKSLFHSAVVLSEDFHAVVDAIFERLQGGDAGDWEFFTQVLTVILCNFVEKGYMPRNSVLGPINTALSRMYDQGPAASETLGHVFHLLAILRNWITASLPENALVILVALRTGLGLWIEDQAEIMREEDFNAVIIPLYCDTLKVLERLPLSYEALRDMEPFLASGFSRIPAPAVAPFAFEAFWRATYYRQTRFYDDLPPRIKLCLTCFVAAYGGDLACGLSTSTESQSQDALGHSAEVGHLVVTRGSPLSRRSSTRISTGGDHRGGPSLPHIANESSNERAVVDTTVEVEESSILDTAFILPSSDDGANSFSLDNLRERTEENEPSFGESPGVLHSNASGAGSPSGLDVLCMPEERGKRLRAAEEHEPRKRSRLSVKSSYDLRKVRSEPVSGRSTPLPSALRLRSLPVAERKMVFDCVEVPTFRSVVQRERMQRLRRISEMKTALPPLHRKSPRRIASHIVGTPLSPQPSSVSSEADVDDDVGPHRASRGLDRTPSEIAVDESLAETCPRSPPPEPMTRDDLPAPQQSTLQIEGSPPKPSPPPLRKSRTTSARLDALRNAYTAVTESTSQISVGELVQATTLVHRIGAALSEQMSKRFGKSD